MMMILIIIILLILVIIVANVDINGNPTWSCVIMTRKYKCSKINNTAYKFEAIVRNTLCEAPAGTLLQAKC